MSVIIQRICIAKELCVFFKNFQFSCTCLRYHTYQDLVGDITLLVDTPELESPSVDSTLEGALIAESAHDDGNLPSIFEASVDAEISLVNTLQTEAVYYQFINSLMCQSTTRNFGVNVVIFNRKIKFLPQKLRFNLFTELSQVNIYQLVKVQLISN